MNLVSRYRVHTIDDPYVTYTIKVILQQLDYEKQVKGSDKPKQIWRKLGEVFLGPQNEIQNIDRINSGNSSTPQVY